MALLEYLTTKINRNINKVIKRWMLFSTKYSEMVESTAIEISFEQMILPPCHIYQAVFSQFQETVVDTSRNCILFPPFPSELGSTL